MPRQKQILFEDDNKKSNDNSNGNDNSSGNGNGNGSDNSNGNSNGNGEMRGSLHCGFAFGRDDERFGRVLLS